MRSGPVRPAPCASAGESLLRILWRLNSLGRFRVRCDQCTFAGGNFPSPYVVAGHGSSDVDPTRAFRLVLRTVPCVDGAESPQDGSGRPGHSMVEFWQVRRNRGETVSWVLNKKS